MGQLIRNQVPDKNGQTLPPDIGSGVFEFREAKSPVPGQLYEGRLIVDKTFGHAVYGCAHCCYMASEYVDMADMTLFVPNSVYAPVTGQDCCDGLLNDLTNNVYDWFSHNESVASVDYNGLVTAVGPGVTTIESSWDTFPCGYPMRSCSEPYTGEVYGTATVADFTVSPAQEIDDGGQGSFSVNVAAGHPTAYRWSFSAPSGAGNSPNVTFTNQTSAQTLTNGHWFALPDDPCTASSSSAYTITATVTFRDVGQKSKTTTLTVKVPWNPIGFVNPNVATISGRYTAAPDSEGIWHITGKGDLARVVPTQAQINAPESSQFYDKTVQHEQVHLNNWIQGPGHLFGDLFIVDDYFNLIRNLTDTPEDFLFLKVLAVRNTYIASQRQIFQSRLPDDEHQAYAVSDVIAPRYLYQSTCPPRM